MTGLIGEIFQHVGKIDSTAAVILMLAVFIIVIMATMQKNQDKREDRRAAAEDKREERRLQFEERRTRNQEETNICLQKTLQDQHTLLAQNSEAVHGLARTLESINVAFQSVSKQIAVSDKMNEKTSHMIEDIQSHMPNQKSLDQLHDKIENLSQVSPSKQDIEDIKTSIADLEQKMVKANSMLTEIRTRQMVR